MTNVSGRMIPFAIIAFFVGLAILMADLVTVARHSYPGEITKDAYKKGLQYNQAIDRTQLQENLGWNGEAKVSWQDLDVNVNFTLKDKNGEKIKDAQVDAWFIRPVQAGKDVKIALVADGQGGYSGKTALAWHGEWKLHISALYNGNNYQQVKNLNIQ